MQKPIGGLSAPASALAAIYSSIVPLHKEA